MTVRRIEFVSAWPRLSSPSNDKTLKTRLRIPLALAAVAISSSSSRPATPKLMTVAGATMQTSCFALGGSPIFYRTSSRLVVWSLEFI